MTEPVDSRIVAYALERGVVSMADALTILRDGADLKPHHKSHAAQAVKRLVSAGWLKRDGRTYTPTTKAQDYGGWIEEHAKAPDALLAAIPSGTAADDPLVAQRERDRIAALMERVAALEAHGIEVDAETRETVRLVRATSDEWRIAVPAMFPSMITAEFAPHHEELFDWVYSVEADESPRPFAAFWSRGHGKSAIAEMACILFGHRRIRHYCLYISGKQQKADDHLVSIGMLLESEEIRAIDPDMASPKMTKEGHTRAWRHNRLTTAADFTIDAVGLDADVRGARIGAYRPDVLIFDDVDHLADSPAQTQKKIDRITKSLMPTRDRKCSAVMFVQNIIHGQSIAASLAEVEGAPLVDFMTRRIISGPIPAIDGLEFAEQRDEELDRNRIVITAGRPTWEDYGIPECQEMIDDEGITAFLSECQHEEGTLKGTMFEEIDFGLRSRGIEDLPGLHENGTWRGPCGTWIDPAVTSTDRSDCCAVVTDGLAETRKIWRLDSWERISTPEQATLRGLESAMRWGSQVCGYEIDQGGDTWEVVYRTVVKSQLEDSGSFTYQRHMIDGVPIPQYDQRRATQDGSMSKRQRIAQMLARYQTDDFRHFNEGCKALEAGLKRFPQFKPYDVADAAYHSWKWLAEHGGESSAEFRLRNPAKRGGGMSGPIAVRR